MKTMRLSLSAAEIATSFKFYQSEKKIILLWQNLLGKRIKVPALVFDINAANEIRFLSVGQTIPFSLDLPLYIYGEYKTLLFKTNIKSIQAGELTVSMPKMVRFAEFRNIKRYDISSLKNCLVSLKKKTTDESNEFTYKLNDISENGLSFLMGNENPVKVGDMVQITQIQTDQISYNLNGKIIHVSPVLNSQGVMDVKMIKVGVKFQEKFKLKDLNLFKKVIKEMA